MQLPVIDSTSKNEKVRVSDSLFTEVVAEVLLAQAIRVYQANLRQSTSHTKTRSEVNRTKKKWYRQKGTGNARHGARTPNIFVGGGVSHGPRGNENWNLKLPQKLKLAALKSALTLQKDNLLLSKDILSLKGQTKAASDLLNKAGSRDEKILVVLNRLTDLPMRALRNLENVLVCSVERLNALQVMSADKIVIDFTALKTLEERLSKVKKKTLKK